MLIDEQGIAAVLDWELVHLGDPLEDLGYLCVPAWRFGGGLAGRGRRRVRGAARFLSRGRRRPGVALRELLWWQAASTVWWGVLCLVQAARHLSGETRSVELAAVGRRACEQEWDALAVWRSFDDVGLGPMSAPHDRSGSGDAARRRSRVLVSELEPQLEGPLRYHLKVAANVVRIVERELRLGEEHAARHRERLARLGFTDDAALAAAIRDGSLDGRLDELERELRAAIADKLAVARPGYAGVDR